MTRPAPTRATPTNTPRDTPDPGSPKAARIALVLAVLLTAVAVGKQNIPPLVDMLDRFAGPAQAEPQPTDPNTPDTPAPAPSASSLIAPPDFTAPFDLMGKLYIQLADQVRSDPSAMPTLDRFAATDVDQLRAAVVAAEIRGVEDAIDRLDTILFEPLPYAFPITDPAVRTRAARDAAVRRDAFLLRTVYLPSAPERVLIKSEIEARGGAVSAAEFFELVEDAKAGRLDPAITRLSEDQQDALIDRHGFYAEVALTHQLPDSDPERAELRAGGAALVTVLLIAATGGAIALLAGCLLFIGGMVLLGTGKLKSRFAAPEPGGSVMLEVFCCFVGGFLAISLGSNQIARLVSANDPTATWPAMIPLAAQWLLLLAPLWPLLRGTSRADLARMLGWNTGRGLFKEIGFGFLAYLAGLPVFLAAVIATLGLITLVDLLTGGSAAPTTSPVVELVAGGSTLSLVLIFLLATVWAPLCEELVFRGALQRHIRARLAGPLAILATAAVFGFMHGYGPLFVLPLIALGFVFGAMRELRGTIIPSITAHFLHNATVLTLVISIVQLTS